MIFSFDFASFAQFSSERFLILRYTVFTGKSKTMSASPDSEIAIDNPSSNETSQEIFTAMCNPSSEEISSISGATGFVTPPESLTGIGDFPSNEEIPSKPSLCMDRPISAVSSDVRQALGNDPSSVNTSSGVSTPSSAYNPDIPPEVSEEATDESGQEVFQTVLEATLVSYKIVVSQVFMVSPFFLIANIDLTDVLNIFYFSRVELKKLYLCIF